MKRLVLVIGLLFILAVANPFAYGAAPNEPAQVGDMFKPFAGKTVDAQGFDLASYYNSDAYIFIDFWAFWCGPCKKAMPDVIDTWNTYGGDRFKVVGVNMDVPSTEQKMHDYIAEMGITFPSVTELKGWDTTISKERNVHYIPQNYLLSPDGTILFRDLHGEELKETVKKLMGRADIYRPIKMSTVVDHDPRLSKDFLRGRAAVAAGIYTNPFAYPLNPTPSEVKLRIHVENPEDDHFTAVLSYDLYRPTGRKTYRVRDPETKAVYLTSDNKPYIFHEVDVETKETVIHGWDHQIDTGFMIPLDPDIWEVSWKIKVHSKFLDEDIEGASDDIDFAAFYSLTREMVDEQGGIIYGREAVENSIPKPAEEAG